MDIRITKSRAAMAALFVLAGVGLGNMLSPLVGDALATVGSTVNISDHSSSAYFAKVDSSGALKTTAVVSGRVAPALPPQPFYVAHPLLISDGWTPELTRTSATVALTDLNLANSLANPGRQLSLYEWSAPAANASCSNTRFRWLGQYSVGSAESLHLTFRTPIVLKPLASGDAWCLVAALARPAGDTTDFPVSVSVGGYVLSGTFTPPSAAEPAKVGRTMRRR
jgi:hypothetical protein